MASQDSLPAPVPAQVTRAVAAADWPGRVLAATGVLGCQLAASRVVVLHHRASQVRCARADERWAKISSADRLCDMVADLVAHQTTGGAVRGQQGWGPTKMYAKTLIPNPLLEVPSLIATTSPAGTLRAQLLTVGWGRFGGPVPPAPTSRLAITHERLQLVVTGEVLLDDLNPAAPPGWWEAVDAVGGRCAVVVVKTGDVDLTDQELAGAQLKALIDSDEAVWAFLPITQA